MPNILSNKKSLRKDKERRLKRIAAKKKLKRTVQECFDSSKDISGVYKILDSQLSKGLIKKNKCIRLKSKYALRLNELKK